MSRRGDSPVPSSSDEENVPAPPFSPCESFYEEDVPQTVVIHSIDADGCSLPYFKKNAHQYETMAEYNHDFFLELIENAKVKQERTVILSGSARQGYVRDLASMFQEKANGHCFMTDSYFFALKKFVDDINAELPKEKWVVLDQFLLDDVCFDRPSGDTFKKAQQYGLECSNIIQSALGDDAVFKDFEKKIDEIKQRMAADVIEAIKKQKEVRQKFGFFWETPDHFSLCEEHPGKFALLYSQIHHVASQYDVDTPLHFHFYDDRLDILWPLVSVFIHARELLPKNMTLYFHHYLLGKQQQNIQNNALVVKKIKGNGAADSCYRQTLREMISKLAVSKMQVGEVELALRLGNPLDLFFEIDSRGDFNPHQFLASVHTVSTLEPFFQFNEDRLIRMGVIKEQSFAEAFEKMKEMDSALQIKR